jgi:hypothetical protein
LGGEVVSLSEIVKARMERKKEVKGRVSEKEAMVERYLEVHRPMKRVEEEEKTGEIKRKLKRYRND